MSLAQHNVLSHPVSQLSEIDDVVAAMVCISGDGRNRLRIDTNYAVDFIDKTEKTDEMIFRRGISRSFPEGNFAYLERVRPIAMTYGVCDALANLFMRN
ncbi:MAG: hypothetical protein P8Y47_02245 [Alphaproteobacteria bacterium]